MEAALAAAREAMELYDGDAVAISAALVFLAAGDSDGTQSIADGLSKKAAH